MRETSINKQRRNLALLCFIDIFINMLTPQLVFDITYTSAIADIHNEN